MGDNDFYSQRAKVGVSCNLFWITSTSFVQLAELGLPPVLSSLSKIPSFAHTRVTLSDVHKTGLGSSAALITSLVAALLLHLSAIPQTSFDTLESEGRKLAHNAAQFIHCFAQGKVGSGFDVSSATFGSQIYTRFDPKIISPLMTDEVTA